MAPATTCRPPTLAAALVSATLTTGRHADAELVLRSWAAGMDGTWNVSESWTPWGVPHNSSGTEYHASIDGGHVVSLDDDAVITALSISSGSEVWIGNGNALWFWAATTEPGGATAYNQGVIRIYAEETSTRLYCNGGPLEFSSTEGGAVILEAGTGSGFSEVSGGGRVINNDGHTFRGAGSFFGLSITNHGLFAADDPTTPLVIRPPNFTAGDCTNDGIMRAEGGATLELRRYVGHSVSTYINTGGVIEALEGSTVLLDGDARFTGGLLRTVGSGVMHCIADSCVLEDITITGNLHVDHEVSLTVLGQIVNNGTIHLDGVAPGTTYLGLTSEGDCTLGGGGTLEMGDNDNWVMAFSGGHLTNGADHTIRGGGSLGRNLLPITNLGIIDAASDVVAMRIDPPAPLGFSNEGTLRVTASGGLVIEPGPFTTTGEVTVETDRTLTRSGTYQQDGGETTVDGTLTVTGGLLALAGGTLGGGGTIVATVDNTGGTVEPGSSPGVLSITGTYTQDAAAAMTVEIGGPDPGTGHDQLAVTGSVTLGGALEVVLVEGHEPGPGDEFTIIASGDGVSGAFAEVSAPGGMIVTYLADSVVVGGYQPCPTDCAAPSDGAVDVTDLLALLAQWGTPGACDADWSGSIDVSDLLLMLASWGTC